MAVAQWERSMSDYASSLPADADPEDVQKVQRKLESARIKLAKVSAPSSKTRDVPCENRASATRC
jgi:hypothetical protein